LGARPTRGLQVSAVKGCESEDGKGRGGDGGRTLSLEDTEDLVTRHEADLGDAGRVTEGNADLRWCEAFTSELCDMLDDVLRGCLEP